MLLHIPELVRKIFWNFHNIIIFTFLNCEILYLFKSLIALIKKSTVKFKLIWKQKKLTCLPSLQNETGGPGSPIRGTKRAQNRLFLLQDRAEAGLSNPWEKKSVNYECLLIAVKSACPLSLHKQAGGYEHP